MKNNIGSIDRIVRIILALIFGILYFTGVIGGVFGVILIILGVIFLLTALINFCPIWAMIGMNTAKKIGK